MSLKHITLTLFAFALLATAAPGASACPDITCGPNNIPDCPPNVPDCIEATADGVRWVGGIASGLICDVLC